MIFDKNLDSLIDIIKNKNCEDKEDLEEVIDRVLKLKELSNSNYLKYSVEDYLNVMGDLISILNEPGKK